MTEIQNQAADRNAKIAENRKDRDFNRKENAKKNTVSMFGHILSGLSKIPVINDMSWYNKNKQLLQDVAQVSYQAPYGTIGGKEFNAQVAVLNYVPVLPHTAYNTETGEIDPEVDAVFVSSLKNLYAQIRKANSGARNYEYQDLIKYTLAIQSMYTTLAKFRRIYVLAKSFNPKNNLFGRKLLSTLNVSTDLINDLPGLRAVINYYIKLLKTYSLPDSMSVVIRQIWLNSVMIKDNSKLDKTQYYLFEQSGYYYIADATSTSLSFKLFDHFAGRGSAQNPLTLDTVRTVLQTMFNGLLEDPYAGIISGDIKKRFEGQAMLELTEVREDEEILIGTSDEVLSQVENTTVLSGIPTTLTNEFQITQNTEAGTVSQVIPSQNYTSSSTSINADPIVDVLDGDAYINMYKDQPTPDDTMVATRLTAALKATKVGNNGVRISRYTCGTEIVLNVDIGYSFLGTTGRIGYDTFWSISSVINGNPGFSGISSAYEGQALSLMSQFDWFPGFYLLKGTASAPTITRIIKEFKNYAVIGPKVLSNMNRVAALSEYGLTEQSSTMPRL